MFPCCASYDFPLKILHQTLKLNCFRLTTSYNSGSTFFAHKWFASSIFFHITLKLIFPWNYCFSLLAVKWLLTIICLHCMFRSPPEKSCPLLPANKRFCLRLSLFTYPASHSFQIDGSRQGGRISFFHRSLLFLTFLCFSYTFHNILNYCYFLPKQNIRRGSFKDIWFVYKKKTLTFLKYHILSLNIACCYHQRDKMVVMHAW